jgi:hypothetical protein
MPDSLRSLLDLSRNQFELERDYFFRDVPTSEQSIAHRKLRMERNEQLVKLRASCLDHYTLRRIPEKRRERYVKKLNAFCELPQLIWRAEVNSDNDIAGLPASPQFEFDKPVTIDSGNQVFLYGELTQDQKDKFDKGYRNSLACYLRKRAFEPFLTEFEQAYDWLNTLCLSLLPVAEEPTAMISKPANNGGRAEGNTKSITDSAEWLTITQAYGISAIPKGTLSRLADSHKLKSNGKKGRARRIDAVDLTRYQLEKIPRLSTVESDTQVAHKMTKARRN